MHTRLAIPGWTVTVGSPLAPSLSPPRRVDRSGETGSLQCAAAFSCCDDPNFTGVFHNASGERQPPRASFHAKSGISQVILASISHSNVAQVKPGTTNWQNMSVALQKRDMSQAHNCQVVGHPVRHQCRALVVTRLQYLGKAHCSKTALRPI